MTSKKRDDPPSVNRADMIITGLKDKLGIKFDKDLSNMLGIKNYDLGNWRRRGSIPTDWYIRIKRDYLKDLDTENLDSVTLNEKNKRTKEQQPMHTQAYEKEVEINQLLREKIIYLEEKINKQPRHTMIPDLPDWRAIEFDVRTYQEYDLRSNYKYFKTYEMKYFEDFYERLGYTKSEAKTEWKKHQDAMTQGSDEFDYDSKLLCDKESSSGFMWDNERTSNFFVDNSKSSMINALQSYKIGYKHKNGSIVHAQIYVMYDFVNMRSKSKIKFIENFS